MGGWTQLGVTSAGAELPYYSPQGRKILSPAGTALPRERPRISPFPSFPSPSTHRALFDGTGMDGTSHPLGSRHRLLQGLPTASSSHPFTLFTLQGPSLPSLLLQLEELQSRLFDVGSAIATPIPTSSEAKLQRVAFDSSHTAKLEGWIDEMDQELPPLTQFILPSGEGGTPFKRAVQSSLTVVPCGIQAGGLLRAETPVAAGRIAGPALHGSSRSALLGRLQTGMAGCASAALHLSELLAASSENEVEIMPQPAFILHPLANPQQTVVYAALPACRRSGSILPAHGAQHMPAGRAQRGAASEGRSHR